MAQLQGKHLAAQIIYPRVYSQIRSKKSRSIRNAHRAAFEHGRHSQWEKISYRPTILKGLAGAGLSKVFTTLYLIVYLVTRATML